MTSATWDTGRIRRLRTSLGWSQSQLAAAINERTGMRTTRHLVSAWESGRVTPSYPAQRALDQIEQQEDGMIYRDTDQTMNVIAFGAEGCEHGWVALTIDHAASSYGEPVLIYDDVAYGPGESIDTPEDQELYYAVIPGLI